MKSMRFATLAFAFALVSGSAAAAELTLVRLNTFPTARSLPFFVGVEKGIFAKHGIKLEFEFTESSQAQRSGLAAGKFEIVHSAVDNALAMIEVAKVDVVIVSGGDGGTNEFIVGKGLNSYADIRGKALVTDAPNTAYAVQAKKILARHGLKDGVDYRINAAGAGPFRLKAMLEGGDNAAAIMNLPFSAQAIEAGMKSLGRTVDLLGPYQAGGAFVLRSWAKANPDAGALSRGLRRVAALGARQEQPRRGHRAADGQAQPVALARHPQLRPDDRAGLRLQSGRQAQRGRLRQRAEAAAGGRGRPDAEPGEVSGSVVLRSCDEATGKALPSFSRLVMAGLVPAIHVLLYGR